MERSHLYGQSAPFWPLISPQIVKAIVDGLLWILMRADLVMDIHYLDDFLIFGAPNSPLCCESLCKALARCDMLCVPISPTKTEGPLVFLGIEIDSTSY